MTRANLIAIWMMAATMAFPLAVTAQGTPAAQTTATTADATGTRTWPLEQLVPLSMREAWLLSGKSEPVFFEMVKELTELSAQKRAITLPDNKEAGAKAGEWIKRQAKKDPDQLLYVVVDRAVQYSARVGTTK